MPDLPSDVNTRAVLQKAAADPGFFMLLISNREAALKGFPLTVAERNLLLAATATQIEKMVEQARHQNWYESPVTRRVAAIAAATGALTLGGLVLVTPVSRGIRPERRSHQYLELIAQAQDLYHEQHGRYGSLEELTGGEKPVLHPDVVTRDDRFTFEVSVAGDSFTAIAREKESKRAWQVGPDGQVKPLE
jgi:hypothetical protein